MDLDDVAAGRLVSVPSLRRWLAAYARFEARDHLGDPGLSIKENVLTFARLHGESQVTRVLMLAHPRTGLGHRLSYAFNPLSAHYCYRADGSLVCVVVEVHNTYGERHAYLVRPDAQGGAEVDKDFYVSPFLQVTGRYRMRFSPPADKLKIDIALYQYGAVVFTAWVHGRGRAATGKRVAMTSLRQPFMALRGSALIRLHGIRLWLGQLPITAREPHLPPPGVAASTDDLSTKRP